MSDELTRESVPGQDLFQRVVVTLVGALSIFAVFVAVDHFGWWSLVLGIPAMAPGLLFFLVGLLD